MTDGTTPQLADKRNLRRGMRLDLQSSTYLGNGVLLSLKELKRTVDMEIPDASVFNRGVSQIGVKCQLGIVNNVKRATEAIPVGFAPQKLVLLSSSIDAISDLVFEGRDAGRHDG